MQITVLCGGPSAEREISLISGKSVAQGLRDAGHDVFVADVSPDDLSALDHPADVVFPVLHGEFGEDGQIQAILESRDIPFVGSGSEASKIGMDKIATKEVWRDAGLPTPSWEMIESHGREPVRLPHGSRSEQKTRALTRAAPCVVKAISSGSSIDVHVCKTDSDAKHAIETLLSKHGSCMVEQFVKGPELTVGLLDGRALPPIRIETSHAFFDYTAKYTQGGAKHSFDLGLPESLVEQCKRLAERANAVVGCRDLARVDILIDETTQSPYLIEINTIPGFTPVSLLPEAAAKTGIAFPQLVDRLVKMALARLTQPRPRVPQACTHACACGSRAQA